VGVPAPAITFTVQVGAFFPKGIASYKTFLTSGDSCHRVTEIAKHRVKTVFYKVATRY
jgi:hypothetical protein